MRYLNILALLIAAVGLSACDSDPKEEEDIVRLTAAILADTWEVGSFKDENGVSGAYADLIMYFDAIGGFRTSFEGTDGTGTYNISISDAFGNGKMYSILSLQFGDSRLSDLVEEWVVISIDEAQDVISMRERVSSQRARGVPDRQRLVTSLPTEDSVFGSRLYGWGAVGNVCGRNFPGIHPHLPVSPWSYDTFPASPFPLRY